MVVTSDSFPAESTAETPISYVVKGSKPSKNASVSSTVWKRLEFRYTLYPNIPDSSSSDAVHVSSTFVNETTAHRLAGASGAVTSDSTGVAACSAYNAATSAALRARSEERRVGKEWRGWRARDHE